MILFLVRLSEEFMTHTHIHVTGWRCFTAGLFFLFRGLLLVSVLSLTTPSAMCVCVCVRSGGKEGEGGVQSEEDNSHVHDLARCKRS